MNDVATQTILSTCSLCEACCGARMDIRDGRIIKVRPDPDEPFGNFICAKGASIPELEADPDRVRTPLIRRNGRFTAATWEEAFAVISERLPAIRAAHGPDAVALYLGNAAARSMEGILYFAPLIQALGTKNFYTSGTVDQVPRQAISALLYGSGASVPVPDLDRCRLLWIMGANPLESNGSLLTATNITKRLHGIRDRGGRIVVIDPRRSATAKMANEHVPLRPTGDAAFLAAVANVLFRRTSLGSYTLVRAGDLDAARRLVAPFTPESVEDICGVAAAVIERLALELAATPAAAVYGRIGTTAQRFGSLTCWLIDLVNLLAGNLDVVGGHMFSLPLTATDNTLGTSGRGTGTQFGRWKSRVSGLPEILGELPVICLPEEVETPGPGQIRAMITYGGNPAVSNPDAARVERMLSSLDLLVCVDIYVNETTRHADVILPPPPRLGRSHCDIGFYAWGIRRYARYTPAFRPLKPSERAERDICLTLAGILSGGGQRVDLNALDDADLLASLDREIARPGSRIAGREARELFEILRPLDPVERRVDLLVRLGPDGDQFGAVPGGLTLKNLIDNPHGLDLGPLIPRLPEILRTQSGTIELIHDVIEKEFARLSAWMTEPRPKFTMVGRRALRSNNSWMHNIPRLHQRRSLCYLMINDRDAEELQLVDGAIARVSTRTGQVDVEIRPTADIARGVVGLPHGWGHEAIASFQAVASAHAGVNVNRLTSGAHRDGLTGTAEINGYPVEIEALV